jgi:hypothetical protein
MARRKRSSQVLEKAERRAAGMASIASDLDLGNGMTLKRFHSSVDSVRDKVAYYNRLLSQVDQAYNDLVLEEDLLAELSERMLAAVSARFGRRSPEYEMAGGSRQNSQRRIASTVNMST